MSSVQKLEQDKNPEIRLRKLIKENKKDYSDGYIYINNDAIIAKKCLSDCPYWSEKEREVCVKKCLNDFLDKLYN
jgi:hypothetical protein